MRDAKRYDSRLEGKQLSTCMLRSRTLGGCAESATLRRLTRAFADISESIRERSRIATGTSFLFCGRDPGPPVQQPDPDR